MKTTLKIVAAGALAAVAAFGIGCKDTRTLETEEGIGGSGQVYDRSAPLEQDVQQDVRMDEPIAPRIGDGNMGAQDGFIDDAQRPLERSGEVDDKMGENPDFWNDNEAPLEDIEADRPEAQ